MSQTPRFALVTLGLAATLFAAACSEPAPAPQPTQPAVQPTVPGVPPISEQMMAKVKTAFAAAEQLAKQADTFRQEGLRIAKTQGGDAANDTLLKARRKYREALEMTEEFIEPELGPFTQEQIDKYLGAYNAQRGRWAKASGQLGKLHD